MVENIGSRLDALCEDQDIRIFLSEAETEDYPYVVYDPTYTPSYDKDGIYKIVADLTVRAYAKDPEEAEDLAFQVNAIILDNFGTEGYTVRTVSQLRKECLQDTWSVSFQYRITQYRI